MAFKSRGVQGQVAFSPTAIVTAGTNVTIQPTKLILFGEEADTNTSVFIVRSGNSAVDSTVFEHISSIADNERVDIGLAGVNLYDGDAIYLRTDTAGRVNYDLSYNERTGE